MRLVVLRGAIRRRLFTSLSEGVRSIARPRLLAASSSGRDAARLALATLGALGARSVLTRVGVVDAPSAAAIGAGICVTASLLVAAATAPPGDRNAMPVTFALLAGVASELVTAAGVSPIALTLAFCALMGLGPERSAEAGFLLALPALVLEAWSMKTGHALEGQGPRVFGALVAFMGGSVGAGALRSLVVRKRSGRLALWLIPLGIATIAYARALPSDGRPQAPLTSLP